MNELLKHVPKSRMPLRWENLSRLVLKVADQRGKHIVDMFTDRISQRTILKQFCKKMRNITDMTFVPNKAQPTNALGMRYDSYAIPILPHATDATVQLNVITDEWFDTYRKARRKRGWKPIALMVDFREFDKLTPTKAYKRNNHRVIYFT